MRPSIAGDINRGVDDEEFGDFVFSSPSSSSHAPSLFPHHASALRQAAAAADDGWTDFLSSSLESSSLQSHSSSPFLPPFDPISSVPLRHRLDSSQTSWKGWEKPKGAIPLSVFGEKDADEPVLIENPRVLDNGFASHSPSPNGKLNDQLDILYDQAGSGMEQDDDFDEGSWEFKDASSSISRSQVDVNRIENGYKVMDHFKSNSHGSITGDLFATHEEVTNRSLGHNHSVAHKFLQEMLPSFENESLSIETNGFKLEFSENIFRNESTENIQADQAEVIYPLESEKGKAVQGNMQEIDDLDSSAYTNGKNPCGSSEHHIQPNTGIEKMDDSPVALTRNIENMYENADGPHATLPSQSTDTNVLEIDQHGQSFSHASGDIKLNQFDWEFQNAVETKEAEKIISCESGQILSNESTSYTLVEFYSRLKEESLSLIVHHLTTLKVPSLPGATPEVKNINKEIEDAYGNLQEMMASEDACFWEKVGVHIDQLLNVLRTLNFKAVDLEYSLSERLLAAEKDLNAAVELFVHSFSVLHILGLTSKEQQLFYINAWSKLALACAQELQIGAKIWTKSRDRNISKQLLVKGNRYFVALGEVFRVSKILKATAKFYMPWLLSNLEDSSEIVTFLERCNELWINSGLEEAIQTISNDMDLDIKDLTKPLLESIKRIDEVIEATYRDPTFHIKHGVCKFYLLPLDKLPEINTVVWNGDCYITKLANFWANRISPDPPQLPSLMPS